MKTRVSSKGQVVLPASLRSTLGIQAGDLLEIEPGDGFLILRQEQKKRVKARIDRDKITGLPVLNAGQNAPILREKTVSDLLADFP
jgi:AbrB family looped-hinge helix DNA binding protein